MLRAVARWDTAADRFTRAIQRRSVMGAEMALRELGHQPPLNLALDFVALVAEAQPHRLGPAAIRWHGRLELESSLLTLSESQLALAALALRLSKALLRRAKPSFVLAGAVAPLPAVAIHRSGSYVQG